MKYKYRYLIAYKSQTFYGNMSFVFHKKVINGDTIKELEEFIAKSNNISENIIITNVQLLAEYIPKNDMRRRTTR